MARELRQAARREDDRPQTLPPRLSRGRPRARPPRPPFPPPAYREGAEGFLYLGNGIANLGLLDQLDCFRLKSEFLPPSLAPDIFPLIGFRVRFQFTWPHIDHP